MFLRNVWFGNYDGIVSILNVEKKSISTVQMPFGIVSRPVMDSKERAVICDNRGNIYCISQHDFQILWKRKMDAPIFSTPVVASNFIIIASVDGRCSCFEIVSGKMIWTKKLSVKILVDINTCTIYEGNIYAGLSKLNEEIVIVGLHATMLVALDITKGEIVSQASVESKLSKTLFVKGNLVYTSVSNGTIYRHEYSDGDLLLDWSAKLPDECFSPPIIIGNLLVIGCRDDNVYGFTIS